jgi:quercetin dioxygenase-like cupin family protein
VDGRDKPGHDDPPARRFFTGAHPLRRISVMIAANTREELMDIHKGGARPTKQGPKESFTGTVWHEQVVEAPAPARLRANRVSFGPGARTHWHTHPLGQTLYVLSGVGRIQEWSGPVREFHAGDTVWIPPEVKHWHGAAPNASMAHLSMVEAKDGTHVQWMEPVTDEQYGGKVGG